MEKHDPLLKIDKVDTTDHHETQRHSQLLFHTELVNSNKNETHKIES